MLLRRTTNSSTWCTMRFAFTRSRFLKSRSIPAWKSFAIHRILLASHIGLRHCNFSLKPRIMVITPENLLADLYSKPPRANAIQTSGPRRSRSFLGRGPLISEQFSQPRWTTTRRESVTLQKRFWRSTWFDQREAPPPEGVFRASAWAETNSNEGRPARGSKVRA